MKLPNPFAQESHYNPETESNSVEDKELQFRPIEGSYPEGDEGLQPRPVEGSKLLPLPFSDRCTITPVAHGSLEWLALRRQLVTASDIPILLGTVGYKTPLGLYREKKEPQPQLTGRQLEFGLHLESLVARWMAEELGARVTLLNWFLTSKLYPYLACTIDVIIYQGDACCPGEIKTARFGSFDKPEDKQGYYDQVQAQMLVTGAEHSYLAILPAGNAEKLIIERVESDKQRQILILDKARDFYNCLTKNQEPTALAEDLSDLHYNPDAENYTPNNTFMEIYQLYTTKKAELEAKTEGSKVLEAELKDYKASMAQMMGDAPKSLFFYNDKEVFISRKEIKVKEQVKPAYTYQKIDIKEK